MKLLHTLLFPCIGVRHGDIENLRACPTLFGEISGWGRGISGPYATGLEGWESLPLPLEIYVLFHIIILNRVIVSWNVYFSLKWKGVALSLCLFLSSLLPLMLVLFVFLWTILSLFICLISQQLSTDTWLRSLTTTRPVNRTVKCFSVSPVVNIKFVNTLYEAYRRYCRYLLNFFIEYNLLITRVFSFFICLHNTRRMALELAVRWRYDLIIRVH